jgi:hypothetical protein
VPSAGEEREVDTDFTDLCIGFPQVGSAFSHTHSHICISCFAGVVGCSSICVKRLLLVVSESLVGAESGSYTVLCAAVVTNLLHHTTAAFANQAPAVCAVFQMLRAGVFNAVSASVSMLEVQQGSYRYLFRVVKRARSSWLHCAG